LLNGARRITALPMIRVLIMRITTVQAVMEIVVSIIVD